jgi:two-component system, chemotaxis family, sensor kinase CheA
MSVSEDNKAYPLAVFRKTYFEECAELLDALQSHLDVLANGAGDNETLQAIFRAVHSIKGGAGAFGFNALVSFSHVSGRSAAGAGLHRDAGFSVQPAAHGGRGGG